MLNFKVLYFHLFNAVTDALMLIKKENLAAAVLSLEKAQYETEELYISNSIYEVYDDKDAEIIDFPNGLDLGNK